MYFCNRCMEMLEEVTVCPHCGFDFREVQNIPHALQPGTVLRGKYLIGNVLGQGGFGITYIGFDLALEVKVAVKEYYVTGNASRVGAKDQTVYWRSDPGNMNHFLTEARRMAMLEHMPEIAHVRDVFYENNTAYIIMEYVKGQELKRFLQKNGTIPYAQTVTLMLPVIEALGRVHEKELVHRDISPDNLMMEPQGTLRVLDLGAAGDLSRNDGQASQLVARHGFSPYEQYVETGKIGPWTDVYAVCATIYYCCTGKVIPHAYARVDRFLKTRKADIEMDPAIPAAGEQVLQKGLALEVSDRIANMQELAEQLRKSLEHGQGGSKKKKGKRGRRKSAIGKWLLAAAAVLVVLGIGVAVFSGRVQEEQPSIAEIPQESKETAPSEVVMEEGPVVLALSESLELMDVELGHTEAIGLLSGPAPEEINWSSSDPKVVKISEQGIMTATGSGSSEIMAEYQGQTAVCTVTVTLKGNVACTYEKNAAGLTITGYEGNLPSNMILPGRIDGITVTAIGTNAFRDCAGLSRVTIPDTVTKIGQYAFSDCVGLTAVTIPDGVSVIEGDAFYGCSGLSSVTIPDSVTRLGENAFSYCTGLTSLTIPKNIGVIERWAFCGCKNLTNVTIPEGVSAIKEGAFRYCTGLTEITVPESVTEIGNSAFRDCTSLTKITLSEGVTEIGEAAFSGCTGLTSITIPGSVKSIRSNAFSGCTGLSGVTFPNKRMRIEYYAFHGCERLTEVTISNACEWGYGAFPTNCTIKFFLGKSDETEPPAEPAEENGKL